MRRFHLFLLLLTLFCLPASATAQRVSASALPDTLNDGRYIFLVVNVPASVVTLYVGDSAVATYPVSAGKRGHATPLGSYQIRQIIWNPDWHPPPSKWAADDHYTPPGPGNPMGRAKLPLDGNILYLHGSPKVRTIGQVASHGCIRMLNQDVLALARAIAARAAPGLDSVHRERIIAHPDRTAYTTLTTPVQARVVYQLAQVSRDSLWVYPDPYRDLHQSDAWARKSGHVKTRVEEALSMLDAAGVPPASIDTVGLRAADRASKGEGFALPLPKPPVAESGATP